MITPAPTDTEWFNRCLRGLWDFIGKQRRQDAAISTSLMLEMQKILEERWASAVKSMGILETWCASETGSLFILTYCGSLCGFKTPKIVLSGFKKQTLSPD